MSSSKINKHDGMMATMTEAHRIRESLEQVSQLRSRRLADPALGASTLALKRLQARRFAGTYADLNSDKPMADAIGFFLNELYGERDFAQRDAQFARIADTLTQVFPQSVVGTACALAELHALTEVLDSAMAEHWPQGLSDGAPSAASAYLQAWRALGRTSDRAAQLEAVLRLGHDLGQLTRKPGLKTLLRLMRAPAQVAGLQGLQRFLEAGFETFGQLNRKPQALQRFLGLIQQRESTWLARLNAGDSVACETQLNMTLGQAR
jgi:hypothetical protein